MNIQEAYDKWVITLTDVKKKFEVTRKKIEKKKNANDREKESQKVNGVGTERTEKLKIIRGKILTKEQLSTKAENDMGRNTCQMKEIHAVEDK